MKRHLIILVLLVTVCSGVSAQFYYGGLSGRYEYPRTNYTIDSAGNVRYQPGNIGFTMQAGAFAGSDFRGHSHYGTYVSPALAYNVSSRFRIKAGVTIFQGFGDANYGGYESMNHTTGGNPLTTGFFIQGDYLLSNKVTLSGAVYKYFSPYSISGGDPGYKAPEGESYMFNINYRPAKHFEINATIEYGRGNGINRSSPFEQNGLFTPPF